MAALDESSTGLGLAVGTRFHNLKELQETIQRFEADNNVVISIADCETLSKASKRVKWVQDVNPELYYKYARFRCYKSNCYRARGKGERNKLSVKEECPWNLFVTLERDGRCLTVKTFHNEHSHPVHRATIYHHPKRRRLNSEEKTVREIKQRQQNWLVQREQSKTKEKDISKAKTVHSHKPTSGGGASSNSTYQPTIQGYKPSNTDQGKKRVTDTFNHWKRSRENSVPYEDNDTLSIQSDAESELERLVSPEHPVAEEEFGSLADKIANRVKQNMGMSEQYVAGNAKINGKYTAGTLDAASTVEIEHCKSSPQSELTHSRIGSSGLASHHCFLCNQLMSSPKHIPLMIIPCGHTICKACSDGKPQCPECNSSVISLTVNIMLQQVIHDYHSQIPSMGASSTSLQKSPTKLFPGENSTASFTDTHRNITTSYKSQLLNLHTRQSILSGEHQDLLEKLGNLSKEIQKTSLQTKSITKQEHEVKKAIVDLQDKLEALETHRKQYESQLTDLHEEKSETEGKLTLLSGTLSSLSREVEKVKLLAEGEETMF